MNEIEFDIIDEIYFVEPFSKIKEETGYSDAELLNAIKGLHGQRYLKVLSAPDAEIQPSPEDLSRHYKDYYYLATKKGLLAHNT